MALMLHPEDAAARNIGDAVLLQPLMIWQRWSLPRKSRLWWRKERPTAEGVYDRTFTKDGLLVNALHHERLSDIGAATTLNDNTVDVKPC